MDIEEIKTKVMAYNSGKVRPEIYHHPLEKIKIIGVMGKNARKITAKMIYYILKEHGLEVGFMSKDQISIMEDIVETGSAILDLEELYRYFYKMIQYNIEIIVIEIENYYCNNFYGIKFDTLVYDNIDVINLDKEEKNDLVEEKDIFKSLSNNGIAILNADDEKSIQLLEGIENKLTITYGLCSRSTVTASSIDDVYSIKFNCCIQRGITTRNNIEIDPMEFPVCITLPGKHNIYNALAAISAVLMYDVAPEKLEGYLKNINFKYI